MDKEIDLSALEKKLQRLTHKLGLHRPDLVHDLGPGLRRLWEIDDDADDRDVRQNVLDKFDELIDQIPEQKGKHWRLAGRISYYTVLLPGMPGDLGLEDRREWLDSQRTANRKSADVRGLPDLPYGTCRRYCDERILPALVQMIGAAWKARFPGEDFPGDNAQSAKQVGDRPTLAPTISDLLCAQVAAAEHLPYWPFDPDMPTLRDVYVETSLKRAGQSDNDQLSLDEALTQDRHLVITGGGGLGKSTLARYSVGRLSEDALSKGIDGGDRRWLPLYVPARLLLGSTGFVGLLASAVNEYLSGHLQEAIHETLFATVPEGCAGWLIFVDGVDEIVNDKDRQRLLTYIARRMTDQRYRFVVLTRTIGDSALRHREESDVGHYDAQPFSIEQQNQFIYRRGLGWRPRHRGYAIARWFMARKYEVNAAEMLRIPLFATIAMLVAERQALTTLAVLCEEFVNYALHRRQDEIQARAQVNRIFSVAGTSGDQFSDWLYDNRRLLLTYIAHQILEGSTRPFATLAADWIRVSYRDVPAIPDWQRAIEAVLADTGLVIRQGATFTFLHRTLAEYIAAPAAGLPGLVAQGLGWVREAIEKHQEQYLIFRILAWARNNEVVPLIHELLADTTCYSLVHQLLREGIQLDREAEDKCVALCVSELQQLATSNSYRLTATLWYDIVPYCFTDVLGEAFSMLDTNLTSDSETRILCHLYKIYGDAGYGADFLRGYIARLVHDRDDARVWVAIDYCWQTGQRGLALQLARHTVLDYASSYFAFCWAANFLLDNGWPKWELVGTLQSVIYGSRVLAVPAGFPLSAPVEGSKNLMARLVWARQRLYPTSKSRMLYGVYDERHIQPYQNDRADIRYLTAVDDGELLRYTEEHVRIGGFFEVRECVDPVDGSVRYAVIDAQQHDVVVVDFTDRAEAEQKYEWLVRGSINPDYPYQSSDVDGVLISAGRSKPPRLRRLSTEAIIVV